MMEQVPLSVKDAEKFTESERNCDMYLSDEAAAGPEGPWG